MRVRSFIYNSVATDESIERVLDLLAERPEDLEFHDLGTGDPEDARREAMLTLRESMRIGENPEGIYGEDGTPEFAAGVLITENEVGRRAIHVGSDALDALEDDSDE